MLQVSGILAEIDEKPSKFSLKNPEHVAQVLRSAKDGFKSIYICSVEERKAHK